jgi:hypothetical protein
VELQRVKAVDPPVIALPATGKLTKPVAEAERGGINNVNMMALRKLVIFMFYL